jgi:hypothetical protein
MRPAGCRPANGFGADPCTSLFGSDGIAKPDGSRHISLSVVFPCASQNGKGIFFEVVTCQTSPPERGYHFIFDIE